VSGRQRGRLQSGVIPRFQIILEVGGELKRLEAANVPEVRPDAIGRCESFRDPRELPSEIFLRNLQVRELHGRSRARR